MSLDMSKLQQQKAKLEQELSRGSGRSAKFWRPKPGNNVIRIMPSWTTEEPYAGQFWREVSQHWGVSEDQKGPILCPFTTPGIDGECPICAFVEELKKDKMNTASGALVKEIRAKKAFLVNVVDDADPVYNAQDVAEYTQKRPDSDVPFEAGDPKIQVYACPKTIFDQILTIIMDNDQDITDLAKGNDITINKSGAGLTTRYTVTPKMKPSESDVGADADFPALDRVGYIMDFDAMLSLLTEGKGGDHAALLPGGSSPSLGAGDEEEVSSADDLEAEMAAHAGK